MRVQFPEENPDPFHFFGYALLLSFDGSLGIVAQPSSTTKTYPQNRLFPKKIIGLS